MNPSNSPSSVDRSSSKKYNKKSYYSKNRYQKRNPLNKGKDESNNTDTTQKTIDKIFKIQSGPYYGWKMYFTAEAFNESSITHLKIQAMEKYIMRNRQLFKFESILECRSYSVNIKSLLSDEVFMKDWTSFNEDLTDNPYHSLNCLGLAMHQMVYLEFDKQTQKEYKCENKTTDENINKDAYSNEIPLIKVHPINYEPIIHLKHLKVNYYGKLISVRGTVIRCGSVTLLPTWIAFSCDICEYVQSVQQLNGNFASISNCSTKGCRSKRFSQLLSHPTTKTVDWQLLKIQEIVSNQCEGGRVPRTIEVELSESLVESCIPGDDITITGVVKVHNAENNANSKQSASMFSLYIDAVSVVNNKNESSDGRSKDSYTGIEFNIKDYYAIQKIHAEPGLVKLLVHSICSKIFGQEMVKFGLLLGLFGGGVGRTETRSDIHILMVGDPGLGKSQLLMACANVAPRGVYVGGNTSTNAGLTVTLTRESGGEFALEAGALVLADQGICCIDEFDKMPTQHQALLEAMEQQSISIAKGGVLCSLRARCGILAAANPIGGHYNKAKTVSENIKLGSALLSRFDLVFILLDHPDEQLDNLLSEHVLALHSALNKTDKSSESTSSCNTTYHLDKSLKERLKLSAGEALDIIPIQLLRKYIAYARRYVHPKLNNASIKLLQSFYMQLRKQHQTADSTPVTARQLQAMVRLTQARAKLELREEATERDALDVIELMRYTLVDLFSDQFGNLDFNRSQNGSGVSGRNQINSSEKLPDKICENCFNEASIAYLFKKKCEQSEMSLRNYVKLKCNNANYLNNELVSRENSPSSVYDETINLNKDNKCTIKDDNENAEEYIQQLENDKLVSRLKCKSYFNSMKFCKKLQRCKSKKLETSDSLHTCVTCGKTFQQLAYLKLHIKIHKGERKHICQICKKSFIQSNSLKIHIRTHTGEKPFLCTVCGKNFSTHGILAQHLTTHSSDRNYKCKICEKSFVAARNLNIHLRTHSDHKPYVCSTCGKGFSQSSGLHVHTRSHTGERPYLCNLCGRKFVRVGHLTVHMRSHTDQRPYKCEICGHGFTQKCDLNVHIKIHTGERNHVCQVCKKGFTTSSSLSKHTRKHTGDKPFTCTTCKKSFTESYSLIKHSRIHLGIKPYSCNMCSRNFTQSGTLQKHMLTHIANK